MAAEQTTQAPGMGETQLTQARVPLEQASDAFASRDASGRIPIVVLPDRVTRISPQLLLAAAVALLAGIGLDLWQDNRWYSIAGLVVAVVLAALGIQSAFWVLVPEGTNALLAQRGRYLRTLGAGRHFVAPRIAVTHVVTRREIPFDVPVAEAPTGDNVRITVDSVVTFAIVDPYRFVYNVSADDFDHVFDAICQEALRAMVRRIDSDQVGDLAGQDKTDLRAAIEAGVVPYGVEIRTATITFAQPPAEFIAIQEARKLAVLERAEQAERQSLTRQRQADEESLLRQRVLAQVAREQDEALAQVQRAEARRRAVEAEAAVEELRLARLEDRLHRFPHASQWVWESERLTVARALAGNTRAVLQVGNTGEIASALVARSVLRDAAVDTNGTSSRSVAPVSPEVAATLPDGGAKPEPGDMPAAR
jgi:regulator of protease activity HflC (stomatin/prohibitin superfamily)